MGAGDITELIRRFRDGDRDAEAPLLELLYPELRTIASRLMKRERPGHTLQTTALIHEAYIKIVGGRALSFEDRSQLLGLASRVMRNLLTDHARSKKAHRRGGDLRRISIDLFEPCVVNRADEIITVHEAIEALAREDERCARAIEGHYFGGLTEKELSACLGVSSRTVRRDLDYAKAWVYDRLAQTAE